MWERRTSAIESGSLRIPTPTAGDAKSSGSRNTANSKANPGISLTDFVRQDGGKGRVYPTPGFNDYKSGKGYNHGDKKQTPQLRHLSGGLLNPVWVEWLMGWPLGWTELKPSATDKCHSAQPLHGEC